MAIKNLIKENEKLLFGIFNRIKKRDFSGNEGLAVKNSIFQFSTTLVAKIGSLLFTIVLARILMPELFGLYSLALSTILIFGALSELGIETTLIRFVSREFEKKESKVKRYIIYLGKIKFFLVILVSVAIAFSAKYIASTFYQKPIFLALLAGILYTIFNQFNGFLKGLAHAANHFSSIFKREIVFQISRIILVPLAVVFAIKHTLSSEINLMLVVLLLSFSLFLASLLLFFDLKRIYLKKIKSEKVSALSRKQKDDMNKFLFATAALVLSGVFFGNIDKVMLGKFVAGSFIGFYTVAFSVVGALVALLGFFPVVLLPIFSRLKGKRLETGFKKSMKITLLLSLGVFLITVVLAHIAISIIYGSEYILATNVLRVLSLLLLILPVSSLYQSYYISQGRPQTVAKLLISASILNIILNYFLITFLLRYGQLTAVYGAALATIISKFFLLGCLVFSGKNDG